MNFFLTDSAPASRVPLVVVPKSIYATWLRLQPEITRNWLRESGMKADSGKVRMVPDAKGNLKQVVACVDDQLDMWGIAHLPAILPKRSYTLDTSNIKVKNKKELLFQLALGWGLSTYRFSEFKNTEKEFATLCLPKEVSLKEVKVWLESTFLARDLINLPANVLTPYELADRAAKVAAEFKAECKIIRGKDLLKHNYPTIHIVGAGSSNPPCLVDIRWGKKDHPKVTLVGKGVTFDSGGLDIKAAAYMKLMKKDMGGAAVTLALARMIMALKLPVRLRLLIPAVENAVSGDAMRPLDVVKTRKGITVEIGNTDAEGRLILCDALAEADTEKPEIIIDCATLTGAARIALGTDMPAFFTDDEKLAAEVYAASSAECDPLWRLPLHKGYEKDIKSDVADITNDPAGQGGAITAALFLKRFIQKTPSWLHLDMMAWNTSSKPGRPLGGEAMALRALYHLLTKRYG